MTTAIRRELARKRPANLPVLPSRPSPTTRTQRVWLRVASALLVAAAAFQMVCAATGYRL